MPDDNDSLGQDEIDSLISGEASSSAGPAPVDSPPPGGALSQDEIEAMINGGAVSAEANDDPTAAVSPTDDVDQEVGAGDVQQRANQGGRTTGATVGGRSAAPVDDNAGVQHKDIELLLSQAENALASVGSPPDADAASGVRSFPLNDFSGQQPSEEVATLDLIRDVELDVRIELGRTHMYLEDVLKLHKGSVVPLDKLAGDPVDIYVNGRLIARGEVLVLNDNFCVRVAELIVGSAARAG